jgi:hypothetical protein
MLMVSALPIVARVSLVCGLRKTFDAPNLARVLLYLDIDSVLDVR